MRMHRAPVPGDIAAPAEPYVLMSQRMAQETLEPRHLARSPGEPAMQPDRHHPWPLRPFRIKLVERIAQIVAELIPCVDAGRRKPNIIRLERVGHDQLAAPRD